VRASRDLPHRGIGTKSEEQPHTRCMAVLRSVVQGSISLTAYLAHIRHPLMPKYSTTHMHIGTSSRQVPRRLHLGWCCTRLSSFVGADSLRMRYRVACK
jgi:hypothetical protein